MISGSTWSHTIEQLLFVQHHEGVADAQRQQEADEQNQVELPHVVHDDDVAMWAFAVGESQFHEADAFGDAATGIWNFES